MTKTGGGARVSIREFRLLTTAELPPVCSEEDLSKVSIGMSLQVGPPPSRNAPVPFFQLNVMPAITNVGDKPVSLDGLKIPVNFNRRVRGMDGEWMIAPPEEFRVQCLSGTVTGPDPSRTNVCDRYISITFTESGIDLKFTAPITLCAGCTFAGTGSDPLFVVQHKFGVTLDRQSVSVGDIMCRDKTVTMQAVEARAARGAVAEELLCFCSAAALLLAGAHLMRGEHSLHPAIRRSAKPLFRHLSAPLLLRLLSLHQVSDPDVALSANEAREHPACSGWIKGPNPGKAPACPTAEALANVRATFKTTLIVPPSTLPSAALGDDQAVTALMASSAAWPSELQLNLKLTNTGKGEVSLAGLRYVLAFPGKVRVPTFDRWLMAGADEWLISCWWGQVNRLGGQRVLGDGNACKYMQLKKLENATGMELVFLGGSLCSGCSLVGNSDGIMFSIKHNSYLQIEADDKALQPANAAATCKEMAKPPFFCGASRAPRSAMAGASCSCANLCRKVRKCENAKMRKILLSAHQPAAARPPAPPPARRRQGIRQQAPSAAFGLPAPRGHCHRAEPIPPSLPPQSGTTPPLRHCEQPRASTPRFRPLIRRVTSSVLFSFVSSRRSSPGCEPRGVPQARPDGPGVGVVRQHGDPLRARDRECGEQGAAADAVPHPDRLHV